MTEPAIRSMHVQGYLSLRDVKVNFAPLTAFVGANGVGKSSLLRVLKPGQLGTGQPYRKIPTKVYVHLDLRGQQIDRSFDWISPATTRVDAEPTWAYQALALRAEALTKRGEKLKPQHVVSETGDNLVHVFDTLPRRVQDQVARALCDLTGTFSDLDLVALDGEEGIKTWRFYDRWYPQVTYGVNEVSTGTMLLLALLVVQHQTKPPDVITIEEPEHGLHPYLIVEMVKRLRDLAQGKMGPAVQVVLSTHSPVVVNALDPSEVRFVSRDPVTGETVVTEPPTTTPEWQEAYENFDRELGGMWLSGSVGGV